MTEGSCTNGRRFAGLVLKSVLNGDRDGLLQRTQRSRDDYLEKKLHLTKLLVEHIATLSDDAKSDFYKSISLELFNDWAPNYSKDMYEHARAVVAALKFVAEETITDRVKKTGQIYVVDFAAGDGNILAYYLHLLRTQHPGLEINVTINDLSKEMTDLALSGTARYDCLNSLDVKPIGFYNPIVKNVNIVSPNSLAELLGNTHVDVAISSQVLDVIRGFRAKRKHLTDAHSALEPGGKMITVGEDPSLFTLSGTLSIAAEVYFGLLHNNQGMGLQATQHELEKISDRNPFHIVAQSVRKIENVQPVHSSFVIVVEKTQD